MMMVFFLFCLVFFGFFDFFLFILFGLLSLILFLLNGFGVSFFGLFFVDFFSFLLMFMSIFLLYFCCFGILLDKWKSNYYHLYLVVFLLVFMFSFLSFISINMFVFYFSFEFIFILMFLFLLGWGYSPERLQSSFYMVFYTLVVSFPFLVFLFCFCMNEFGGSFMGYSIFGGYWVFFVFLVFLVKLPVYGAHLWLPKAHVEAPVGGSMVLAGVLLKLGGYGIFRFSFFVNCELFKFFGYMASLGLIGGLLSCFLCLRQVDLKAFVAYSSVCHMGFGLMAGVCNTFFGIFGFVFMLIAHGFVSSCLFYLLYLWYKRFGSRSLVFLKGVGIYSFVIVYYLFFFSVLNMGVPPSFAFFSEVFILVSGISFNLFIGFFCGFLLFFAGVYSIYFFVTMSHGGTVVDNVLNSFFVREILILQSHLFPLFLLVLVFFA